MLLKEDMCENGLESLTKDWVIFESKSPKDLKKKMDREMSFRESSKSPMKFSSSSPSSTLLKVRDYLDDDVKSAAPAKPNSRARQEMGISSEVTNTIQIAAIGDSETCIPGKPDLTSDTEIPRPVAIKPSNLTGQFTSIIFTRSIDSLL